MPRMQVYLPEALYRAVKKRKLHASELLQKAVREEIRQLRLEQEYQKYMAELDEELGPPTEQELAEARARIQAARRRSAKRRAS